MPKNVFVVGLDEVNRRKLESIRDAGRYRFHELLPLDAVTEVEDFPVDRWLDHAEERLDEFEGSIDGIIGFWDFPVSLMVPHLCTEHGTRGPSLEVVARCEHKFWSRVLQREVIPEAVPRFQALDPFGADPESQRDLDFPFWLKPVKAYGSQLGFRIDDPEDFARALETTREGIDRFARPFDRLVSGVSIPEEIAPVDGRWCVAEEILQGTQHTVAGYAREGKIETYGVIDSINYPDHPSFLRYHYPSRLPESTRRRMAELCQRVMEHVGFRDWPFNIEFFHDEENDRLMLLEINTRISQSHSDLFQKVDGTSNHEVLVRLATGETPEPPEDRGPFGCAAKFHWRTFEDGEVTRVPTREEIARVEEEFADTIVIVEAEEGERLGEMTNQDAYSYRVGIVYMGADDEDQLLRRWDRCREILRFEIDGDRI